MHRSGEVGTFGILGPYRKAVGLLDSSRSGERFDLFGDARVRVRKLLLPWHIDVDREVVDVAGLMISPLRSAVFEKAFC
jgi:hypothetical protein